MKKASLLLLSLFALLLLVLGLRRGNLRDILKRKLKAAGYSPEVARYLYAVSRFETGDFQSALAKYNNNYFGMKHPRIRKTTSIAFDKWRPPEPRPVWAKYVTMASGVDDLILYLNNLRYPKSYPSIEHFVTAMKQRGYFEEPLLYYLNGVKSKLI